MPYRRLSILLLAAALLSHGEKGVLNLFVLDLNQHPLGLKYGVQIQIKDPYSTSYPDDNGIVPVRLGSDIGPGDALEVALLAPDTLFIVSPWDNRVIVPTFANKGSSFVNLMLAPKGSVEALRQARVREAIAARIAQDQAPQTVDDRPGPHGSELAKAAKATGYTTEQLRSALGDWAKTAESPRAKAIAALFAGDYNTAVQQSEAALKDRSGKGKETAGQDLFELSLLLAQALYETGDFARAADQAKVAVGLRPRDERALNFWGICLAKAGKTDTAMAALRSAAAIERQLSSSSAATFNVAEGLYRKGELSAADTLYHQVLDDQSKLSAPDAELVRRAQKRLQSIAGLNPPAAAAPRTSSFWRIVLAVVAGIAALLLIGFAIRRYLVERRVRDYLRNKSSEPTIHFEYRTRLETTHHYDDVLPYEAAPNWKRLAVLLTLAAVAIGLIVWSLSRVGIAPPANTATATRAYTVDVAFRDPSGGSTSNVNCWSSIASEKSRSSNGWQFRFVLAHNAQIRDAEFFADDAETNRSGRARVPLGSEFHPRVTIRLEHGREPGFNGIVVDRFEKPVSHAVVSIVGSRKLFQAGADGRFAVPPDENTTQSLLVSVAAPGFQRAVAPLVPGQRSVRVTLSPQ